jgi:7-cyano-7-deazaguanine synthase in queuosine biosynthesis
MSCMKPVEKQRDDRRAQEIEVAHCGECSKCRERHDAFVEANVLDPTDYESLRFTGR